MNNETKEFLKDIALVIVFIILMLFIMVFIAVHPIRQGDRSTIYDMKHSDVLVEEVK